MPLGETLFKGPQKTKIGAKPPGIGSIVGLIGGQEKRCGKYQQADDQKPAYHLFFFHGPTLPPLVGKEVYSLTQGKTPVNGNRERRVSSLNNLYLESNFKRSILGVLKTNDSISYIEARTFFQICAILSNLQNLDTPKMID